jgi:hypothetical protein
VRLRDYLAGAWVAEAPRAQLNGRLVQSSHRLDFCVAHLRSSIESGEGVARETLWKKAKLYEKSSLERVSRCTRKTYATLNQETILQSRLLIF